MTLDHANHIELARRLHESQRTRVQLEQFSRLYPQMEIEDSYAIQKAWMDLCLADGEQWFGEFTNSWG